MIGLCVTAPGMAGGGVDGSAPFICVVMVSYRARLLGACEQVGRDVLELPPFVRVNVAAKALEAMDGRGRKTAIHSSALVKEKARLILQGGENGRAWSSVIDQKTGEMTAAGRLRRWRLPHRGRLHAAIAETMGVSSSAGVSTSSVRPPGGARGSGPCLCQTRPQVSWSKH